jgi:membrane fusion protein (multidrug efflux system)
MTGTTPRSALALCLALSLGLSACSDGAPGDARSRRGGPVPVVAEPVTLRPETLRLEAVGTSQARQSVELFAETTGDVKQVAFGPGDFVEAGAILVALEAEDEELALALAEVQLADAEQLLERYRRANERGERTVPETTVDATETALASAKIARDRAAVALERRRLRAPFAGYVGFSELDPGDRVDASTAVTTLDDRQTLLINFEIPEAYLGTVTVGDAITVESWTAKPVKAMGTIVDLGARVDPLTRAFIARAAVSNEDDRLRPGMSFRVSLNLTAGTWPAIPELSLQWGADGPFLWKVEEGKARRVTAKIIQRQAEHILVDAPLEAGELIVSEGVQAMRPGVAVMPLNPKALAQDARAALRSED